MSFTKRQYFGDYEPDTDQAGDASTLALRCQALFDELGVNPPLTSGFRTRNKQILVYQVKLGAAYDISKVPMSSRHMFAQAADFGDANGSIDSLITDELLEKHDLYREAPEATPTWVHLQTVPPHSGQRTFKP